jgi:hypothetical protein
LSRIIFTRNQTEYTNQAAFQMNGLSSLSSGCLAVAISLSAIKVFTALKIDATVMLTAAVSAAVTITAINVCRSMLKKV